MKEFWDKRYAVKEMAYGEEPNVFFASEIKKLKAGKILLPAEGEGRNAIFSAKQGWEVSAFDMSVEGKKKADDLAASNHVSIDYKVGEFNDLTYENESFDCIVLIYAHFPSHLKSSYHQKLNTYLKKDGIIILEGFSKKNTENSTNNLNSGGPKNKDMLFSKEEIQSDFSNYEIIELSEKEVVLDEGLYHNGKSWVVRFVGKKK